MDILVFEQNNSGKRKIEGIREFGHPGDSIALRAIDGYLSEFVDEPEEYIDADFHADLVLNYLVHPDLSQYLIQICKEKNIPVIASGQKSELAYTPFTCCGLGRHQRLGSYGERFGFPEFRVEFEGDRISRIEVERGAPCGATWEVISEVIGVTVEEAMSLLPRLVQYQCSANPGRFDPVTGKSPVHFAGYTHRAALKKACDLARRAKE